MERPVLEVGNEGPSEGEVQKLRTSSDREDRNRCVDRATDDVHREVVGCGIHAVLMRNRAGHSVDLGVNAER